MKYYIVPQIEKELIDLPGMKVMVPDCNIPFFLIQLYPLPADGAIVGCESQPENGVLFDLSTEENRLIITTNGGIIENG